MINSKRPKTSLFNKLDKRMLEFFCCALLNSVQLAFHLVSGFTKKIIFLYIQAYSKKRVKIVMYLRDLEFQY